jgi:hypothetical protein
VSCAGIGKHALICRKAEVAFSYTYAPTCITNGRSDRSIRPVIQIVVAERPILEVKPDPALDLRPNNCRTSEPGWSIYPHPRYRVCIADIRIGDLKRHISRVPFGTHTMPLNQATAVIGWAYDYHRRAHLLISSQYATGSLSLTRSREADKPSGYTAAFMRHNNLALTGR